MERITKAKLKARIDRLNDLFGYAREPYKGEMGNISGNPNTYVLDCAYNAYRLSQMVEDGGTGERDISPRLSARELYTWLGAYISGIEAGTKAYQAKIRQEAEKAQH